MQHQDDYFSAYHNLKLTRDAKGVLVAEFHSDGAPFIMTAQAHTEFVDAFYRIAEHRPNKTHLLAVSGGYVGVEMSQAMRRFGSKVTIVDSNGRLMSKEDPDVCETLLRSTTGIGSRCLRKFFSGAKSPFGCEAY